MPTITQRLTLDGADEIKAAFAAIGKVGADAFKKINDAAKATQNLRSLAPTLDEVKARLATVSAAGRDFNNSMNQFGGSVRTFGIRLALVASVVIPTTLTGFALLIRSAANAAEEIGNTAESIGLTVEQFQELRFVAIQNGLSTEQFVTGMTRLGKAMGEQQKAALETGKKQRDLSGEFVKGKISAEQYLERQQDITKNAIENITAFTRLKIATHNSDGTLRAQQKVLLDISDAFAGMQNGAEKTALAQELFGRAGAKMIPFLNQGSAAILAFRREQERLAPALTKSEQAIGQKLNNAFELLGLAVESTKNKFALAFAPATLTLVNGLTEVLAQSRGAIIAFAQDLADKAKPIIDDFLAVLQGRDADVKNSFVLELRDGIVEFGTAAKQAFTFFKEALTDVKFVLDQVAAGINAIFGTKISGSTIAIIAIVGQVTGAFGVLAGAIRVVISAVGLLDAALVLAFGPAGAAFAGLILLAAAIGALIVQIPGVRKVLDPVLDGFLILGRIIIGLFKDGIPGAIQAAQAEFDKLPEDTRKAAVEAVNGVVLAFLNIPKQLGDIFDAVVEAMKQKFFDGVEAVKEFFRQLVEDVKKKSITIANTIKNAFRGGGGGGNTDTGGADVQAAGGGYIRGPGGPTGDKIRALLSDREYVQRAKAVRTYGVDFMNALNSLRIPVSAVRALMGGVDMGGLRHALRPRFAFADGGLAVAGAAGGSMQPVNINLNGHTVPALMSSDSLTQLRKFSVASQMRSMGRKPSWFQG